MESRLNTKGYLGQLSAPQPLFPSQELSAPKVSTAEAEKLASFFSFPSLFLTTASVFFCFIFLLSTHHQHLIDSLFPCLFVSHQELYLPEELIVWVTYVSAACRTVPDMVVQHRGVCMFSSI